MIYTYRCGQNGENMSEDKYFKKALTDFTIDFASGGAIRHLADKGYTVSEIHARLDFPTPMETVRELVWKHYVNTGVILLSEPDEGSKKEQVTYEKVTDSLGRVSFKQVVVKDDSTPAEYIACDFGKEIYKDKRAFGKSLEGLSESDRNYILELPWPLTRVWHIKNDRIERIVKTLRQEKQ